MSRIILLLVGLITLLSACTQRMICPAFQSAYIYDKEALRQKFSYFKEDSTPKILTASKTKYLIAVPESYRKKMRNLRTVEMKPVYPVIPDSLKMDEGADLSMAERDVVDSAAMQQGLDRTDSAYAISKEKEKFNVDQDNYMWYFRDVLVLPDVKAALEQKSKEKLNTSDVGNGTGKKRGGFFRNLFKKKDKNDSTAVNSPALPANSDSTATEKPKKGKLFRKKKDNVKKKEKAKKEDPAKKDEDDGF